MLPLISLVSMAAGLVPELIGLFGGSRAGEVASKVSGIIRDVTGTNDPAAATQAIEANPAKATQLRVRLEEIKQRYTELQVQDAQAERQAMLDALRAEIEDRKSARGTMVSAAGMQDWAGRTVALGPPVVSVIILLGFFVFTVWLVRDPPQDATETTKTLLNVVIGALVAGFTAVINFWLGSSQGSRDKDRTVVALQEAQARQATQAAELAQQASMASTASVITAMRGTASVATAAEVFAGPLPGTPSRFELCLEVVLDEEGGFSNHPEDPGRATMMGITQETLAAWRQAPVTPDDVRALTREEAHEIYRANYWNAMRCDDLPRGVDVMVFDFGVNAGPATSVRALQRAAGAEPDGAVGALTLRAVRASDPRALVEALVAARLEYYRRLKKYETFGKGWESRVAEVRKHALLMATV